AELRLFVPSSLYRGMRTCVLLIGIFLFLSSCLFCSRSSKGVWNALATIRDTVLIDSVDASKFLGLTTDPYVHSALRRMTLGGANSWATLQQAIALLKAEGMKLAVGMGDPGLYLDQPLLPGSRNLLLEGCPAGWRPYLIPLFMAEQGTPISQVIEKLGQMGDLPGIMTTENSTPRPQPMKELRPEPGLPGERSCLFKQLLEQGIPKTEIDRQPLLVLRRLAQQGNKNQVRKIQSEAPGFAPVSHSGFQPRPKIPQYPWKELDKTVAQFHPKAK
uniref:Uncharacterized protein n=1 Tax=Buteo japonicus TaxID=224669 RepID=A0A8C0HHX8_9AVES